VKKAALFAFNGELMCFVHVLLNGFNLKERGWQVEIVIEGSACRLIKDFEDKPDLPFAPVYRRAKEAGLIAGACRACCTKMDALESAIAQGLNIFDDMNGHPSVGRYWDDGYQVLTF
jgi:hypothetical protein